MGERILHRELLELILFDQNAKLCHAKAMQGMLTV